MTIKYVLDKNDYLQYQLFAASKNERIKKKRKNSWILACITSFCMSYLFFSADSDFLGYYFLVTGTLSVFFYPLYQRWHYKKHYKKHVEEQRKNLNNEECEITFTDQHIITNDRVGISTINIKETEVIYETEMYFFVRLKTGHSLIISKNTLKDIHSVDVRNELTKITHSLSIQFVSDLNWKWK